MITIKDKKYLPHCSIAVFLGDHTQTGTLKEEINQTTKYNLTKSFKAARNIVWFSVYIGLCCYGYLHDSSILQGTQNGPTCGPIFLRP